MTAFNVVVDTTVLEKRLTKLERQQLPFARSLAANTAAFETRATVQKAMPLFLDRPTQFTVRGVRVRTGNKALPAAEVYITDDKPLKGTSPAKYLNIVRGGRRGQRRSEATLRRAGILGDDEAWVPGEGLRLNRFGNPTRGQITKILSGIKAFGEEGFQANLTAKSRARGVRRGREEYFLSRGGKLPRGVYQRTGRRKKARNKYKALPSGRSTVQRGIKPVLLFVPLPRYSKQFDFRGIAAKELNRRFRRAWPAALRRALATAR